MFYKPETGNQCHILVNDSEKAERKSFVSNLNLQEKISGEKNNNKIDVTKGAP